MPSPIREVLATEVLDSRGIPTLEVTCELANGARASASVPAGRSKGASEAAELRDGDPSRFNGFGCLKAAAIVNGQIADALVGRSYATQDSVDTVLQELVESRRTEPLGANSTVGVSVAFARTAALSAGQDLFEYFNTMLPEVSVRLPGLSVNLFSGGKHAGEQVGIQDVLVVPRSEGGVIDQLAIVADVYRYAGHLILRKYGARMLTADEGGLAPPFESDHAILETAVEAVHESGQSDEVSLACDVAASHLYQADRYRANGSTMTSEEMVELVAGWNSEFQLVSVEDGLDQNDWDGWVALTARIGNESLVVADDLTCTNPELVKRAIDTKAANALLVKVNQIGTLSEAAIAVSIARAAGWKIVLSARSGETEDHWLADLAVGWAGDFIKVGSITQSERLSKYNRLMAIERILRSRGL